MRARSARQKSLRRFSRNWGAIPLLASRASDDDAANTFSPTWDTGCDVTVYREHLCK
jgi:hypothetical protein